MLSTFSIAGLSDFWQDTLNLSVPACAVQAEQWSVPEIVVNVPIFVNISD